MPTRDGRFEIAVALAMTSNWVTVDARSRPFVTNPPNLFELEFNWLDLRNEEKLERFKYNLSQLLPDVRDEIRRLPVHEWETVGEFADRLRRLLARQPDERRPTSGSERGSAGNVRPPRITFGQRLTRGAGGERRKRVVNLGFAETSTTEPFTAHEPAPNRQGILSVVRSRPAQQGLNRGEAAAPARGAAAARGRPEGRTLRVRGRTPNHARLGHRRDSA